MKLTANRVGNLYYVRENSNISKAVTDKPISFKTLGTLISWHRRLEHINIKDLLETEQNGINIEQPETSIQCNIYAHRKITKAPFSKRSD